MKQKIISRQFSAYRILALPLMLWMLFSGACDGLLPTKLEPPTWNTTLSIPIINKSYPLSDLAGGSDSLLQMQGDSLYIEFSDELQTVTLGRENFFVPAGTDPLTIQEELAGLSFDTLSQTPDPIRIPIPEDLIQPDTANPFSGDSVIYKVLWNGLADTLQLDDSTQLDIPQSSRDEISSFFSGYSIVIDENSSFRSSINNRSPGIIEEYQLALMFRRSDGSSYLLADHHIFNIGVGVSFVEEFDLSGKRIDNLDLYIITRLKLKQTDSDLPASRADANEIVLSTSLNMTMKEVRGVLNERNIVDEQDGRPLPATNETQIIRGVLDIADADTNRIGMSFENNFPMSINLRLEFLNFFDPQGGNMVIDTLIPSAATVGINSNLNGYTLASLNEGRVMEQIAYRTKVDIPATGDTVIFPFDGEPIGDFGADIRINDFQLASLRGIFGLDMPSPPTAVNIPQGMTGIGIAEPKMTLNLENGISLPIELKLHLVAKKLDDTLGMRVAPVLNFPIAPDTSASTSIILDHEGMQVFHNGIEDPDQQYSDYPSLADLINLGPDSFIVNTTAAVQGEGSVAAGRKIRGSYSVLALLKIFPDTQVFIPENRTSIEPWDSSFAEQVLTTAVEGLLNATVISRFPLGGRLGMLLSDSTVFPENRLQENLDRAGVDSIANDTLYFTDGKTSWIDTLFRVHLPSPRLDPLTGAASETADTSFISTMDYQAIQRLAENKRHYTVPKITLYGTDQAAWIRSSDFVTIRAFLGFTLRSDGIFGSSDSDSSSTEGGSR